MIPRLTLSQADLQRPVVLCLHSLQFVRDVKMLQRHSTRYAWPSINDLHLIEEQKPWMPERLRLQAYYVNESGADVDAAWARAKQLGLGLLRNLLDQGANLTAVMAGNWDYWNEECVRLACDELGIPFLVLMREHDLTGYRRRDAIDFYGPLGRMPNVAGVAFAGETSLELLTEIRLFPRAKLRATGWPRLDAWRAPAAPLYDRPIVLMSYFKGYNATEDFVQMMHVFAALSRQYPDVPFIVKAKHGGEVPHLQQISDMRGLNLTIIDTPALPALVGNARAVIGFFSTVMYEALLAPTRILIPKWGQTDQDPMLLAPCPTDSRLEGHMEFLSSEDVFREAIEASATTAPPSPDMTARVKLFGEYFTYSPDRTAVERVEDFLDEFGKK